MIKEKVQINWHSNNFNNNYIELTWSKQQINHSVVILRKELYKNTNFKVLDTVQAGVHYYRDYIPSTCGDSLTYSIEIVMPSCTQTLSTVGYRFPEVQIDTNLITIKGVLEAKDTTSNNKYHWYNCLADTLITSNETPYWLRTIEPTDTGTYACVITKGMCIDTTECVAYYPVGLNENHFQKTVNFYPNPTKGTLSIETGAIHESLLIKVRNIHGQLVQIERYKNQRNLQLQIKGKAGIYFIELVNGKGERANLKLIKR